MPFVNRVLPACFGGLRAELLVDSFPCLQGKKIHPGLCWRLGLTTQRLCKQNLHLLTLLCWDVSLGSQISCSSACPSHAARRGSHGWAGAACWLLSPRAQQHRTRRFPLLLLKPSSSGVRQSRRFPCRGYSGSGQADAKALPAFFLLVWLLSTGAARRRRREMHACKNQCENINQAKSERLKKSRGSRAMCVIERGFLYLQRPPRLPSCRGKPKLSAPLSRLWLAARARRGPAVPAWVLMPCALQAALPSPCRGGYL